MTDEKSSTTGGSGATFCAECGEKLEPGFDFCTECGSQTEDVTSVSSNPDKASRWQATGRKISQVPKGRLLLTAGLLSVLLLAGLGVFWYLGRQSDMDKATSAITAVSTTETTLRRGSKEMDRVADIQVLAKRLDAQLPELRKANQAADGIGSSSRREKVKPATQALLDGAVAIAATKKIDRKNLAAWKAQRARIRSAAERMKLAWPALVEEGNERGVTGLRPAEQLIRVAAAGDQVVARARRLIAAWRIKRNRARAARRDALIQLASYQEAMGGQVSRYEGLRDETQEFLDRANNGGYGITFDDAYDFISDAQSDRADVQSSMRSLTPPAEALDAHSGMVNAIGNAASALDNAYYGLQEYQADKGSFYSEYSSFRDTPSWSDFISASDSVAAAWSSAVSTWRSGVDAARQKIKKRAMPKAPAV